EPAHPRDEEPVGPIAVRQELHRLAIELELRVVVEEPVDLARSLRRRDRAGGVHEGAARPQLAGRRVEQLALERGQLPYLLRALAPARVRARLERSQIGAGRVEKDPVEGLRLDLRARVRTADGDDRRTEPF